MLAKELTTETRVPLRFIEPMYAEAIADLPAGAIWSYEAKLDGYRCLAAKQGKKIELWSRRGNSFKLRWPDIARAIEKLPADTLIDGEVSQSAPTAGCHSMRCSTVGAVRTCNFMRSIF
jgi:ATP-dependent DNA ligase